MSMGSKTPSLHPGRSIFIPAPMERVGSSVRSYGWPKGDIEDAPMPRRVHRTALQLLWSHSCCDFI
jgi:hypothetical protein